MRRCWKLCFHHYELLSGTGRRNSRSDEVLRSPQQPPRGSLARMRFGSAPVDVGSARGGSSPWKHRGMAVLAGGESR